VRLTYDHKGSDQQEAQRITDAGGYVMNNRVNGMLFSGLLRGLSSLMPIGTSLAQVYWQSQDRSAIRL
jgi:protein phosphatase PTC1